MLRGCVLSLVMIMRLQKNHEKQVWQGCFTLFKLKLMPELICGFIFSTMGDVIKITYHNILRTKEFCINFISARYFDACYKTVFNNADDTDEIAVGGFTAEAAVHINAPRIQEAFLSLKCTLHSNADLSGKGISSLVIGRVISAAMEEDYLNGCEKKYGQDGFMYYLYDLHDFATGDEGERKVASLNILGRV